MGFVPIPPFPEPKIPIFPIHLQKTQNMKNPLKTLLIPALCAFFLLQAQQANAQSKDNDVLVMEYGFLFAGSSKTHGLYIFWPDKDSEFIQLENAARAIDLLDVKKTIYRKINELADLGWELDIIDNSLNAATGQAHGTTQGSITFYFKRSKTKWFPQHFP